MIIGSLIYIIIICLSPMIGAVTPKTKVGQKQNRYRSLLLIGYFICRKNGLEMVASKTTSYQAECWARMERAVGTK